LTAPIAKLNADGAAYARVETTCQTVVNGRRAARILGGWSELLQLTEPEVQILWCLRDAATQGVDQTTLATQLAFSPALISACVEKLRARDLITNCGAPGDRRRRLWQLTAGGCDSLQKIVEAAGQALQADSSAAKNTNATRASREAAA
jgi:DNA-binding MarR family transcriptional regulator